MERLTRLSVDIERFGYPDGTVALADVRLDIAAGEFCGLLGANGSGKTTLLKIMDGLIRDYRGTMLLDGTDILKLHPREIYRKMGLVFQNPDDQLFAGSVFEDVAFGPRNMGFDEPSTADRVAAALAQVEMDGLAGKNIHHLSYGQKKRVCIAGLLSMGHEILLLDEPTAGLDPRGEQSMMAMLARLNRDHGVTIVMATHAVDLVPLFLDRLHILSQGRLMQSGTPEEIFTGPEEMAGMKLRLPYIAELMHQLQAGGRIDGNHLPLTVGDARREITAMMARTRELQ